MQLRKYFPLLFALVLGLGFSACVDLEYDEPPVRDLPNVTANTTIAALKDKHTLGNTPTLISEDLIIGGTVVADDRTGNFYQQLVIQDETAGIVIRLGASGLFGLYPEGSEVFVKLQGLYIGDYRNLYQISGDVEGNIIANPLIAQYVIPGEVKPRVPETVTLAQIIGNTSAYLSELVQINEVEFANSALGFAYGSPGSSFSGENRDLQDCDGNTVILRNSNFADFVAVPLPSGNGTITAVVSVFGSDIQLQIRDVTDVAFTGGRCDGSTGMTELVSVRSIRDAYAGGSTSAPVDTKIRGVVISDRAANNINSRNIYIQDGTAGILVRFSADHDFDLGEEVEITVSGQELSEFNGLLQVNNVPVGLATSIGAGILPTPRVATISEIRANGEAWESTLVQVQNATLSGGGTFAGNRTVSDATGDIPMFTLNGATFSGNALPTGQGILTGIVSDFNGIQLNMRNAADADFDGGTGDPTAITAAELRALFTGTTTSAPAAKVLTGVVISDKDNANITTRNLVIQDATGGIVVRFAADHAFALGEQLTINVGGMELSEFNGLLQLNNVPIANATSNGNGTLPTPRVATINEILANSEAWESTLVRINDVSITAGGTYSGTKTVSSASGSIDMFTRTQASFAGANVPAGTFSVVAIVSQFTTPQINIRNLSDIIQ